MRIIINYTGLKVYHNVKRNSIVCKLCVRFIIRIEGVKSSKIFNAVQHRSNNMDLFNSVYTYAKTELGLTDTDALTLAQFIVDNQSKLIQE